LARISSISNLGMATVTFDVDIILPTNETTFFEKIREYIKVTVYEQSYKKKEFNDYTWTFIELSKKAMMI
jgi:hypothetical protein